MFGELNFSIHFQSKMLKNYRVLYRPISSIPINGGSGTKFVVSSQAASAAYSNPTRPYYGNPSAAAMGITVRPAVEKGESQVNFFLHSMTFTWNTDSV